MPDNQFQLLPIDRDKDIFFTHSNNLGNENFSFSTKGIAFITDRTIFSSNVRKCIENFKNHFKNISLYDAGIVEKKDSDSLSSLIHVLNQKGIIPFFIGIDLDILGNVCPILNSNLYQISNKITNITNTSNFVKNNFIAYQRHLCELDDIFEIEDNYYNALSLGKIRTYPYLVEPVARDCQLLHINLDAFRSSECPNIIGTLPTGLNAEELCQLMKYLGSANDLKAICFNSCELDGTIESSKLIAEALWYFAEGMNLQQNYDHPSKNPDYSQFTITTDAEDIEFIKNNTTLRWWVKKTAGNQSLYMACAFEEYEICVSKGEPTDRIQKFLNN